MQTATASSTIDSTFNSRFNNFRFIEITPEVWNNLKQRLNQVMNGRIPDRGNLRGRGFRVNWKYDRVEDTLDVLFLETPPVINSALLNLKLMEFINACR